MFPIPRHAQSNTVLNRHECSASLSKSRKVLVIQTSSTSDHLETLLRPEKTSQHTAISNLKPNATPLRRPLGTHYKQTLTRMDALPVISEKSNDRKGMICVRNERYSLHERVTQTPDSEIQSLKRAKGYTWSDFLCKKK